MKKIFFIIKKTNKKILKNKITNYKNYININNKLLFLHKKNKKSQLIILIMSLTILNRKFDALAEKEKAINAYFDPIKNHKVQH